VENPCNICGLLLSISPTQTTHLTNTKSNQV
jgi:hypothetical protein